MTPPTSDSPPSSVSDAKCATCNGRGEIGGLLPGDGGYQTDPCPTCSPRTDSRGTALPPISESDGAASRVATCGCCNLGIIEGESYHIIDGEAFHAISRCVRLLQSREAAQVNNLAAVMLFHGLVTGHGDTHDGLLHELNAQLKVQGDREAALVKRVAALERDAARIQFLEDEPVRVEIKQRNFCDTGEASVEVAVIEQYMDASKDRQIGRGSTWREAIDAALAEAAK